MMADFICQFANCDSIDTPIVVSHKTKLERNRFCCEEHAARYLLRNASLAALDRIVEDIKQ